MKIGSGLERLPGGELIRQGLADYAAGDCTIPACLIGVAHTRLSRAGLLAASVTRLFAEPERQLYFLLRQETGDPYSRYNALLRELISFEQALDIVR